MAEQKTIGSNFEHGDTYLTGFFNHAKNYAGNQFGSEIISTAATYFGKLVSFDPSISSSTIFSGHRLLQVFQAEHRPIVLEIKDLPVAWVASETGDDPSKFIELLKVWKALGEDLRTTADGGGFGFRLKQVVHAEGITVIPL